MSSRVCVIGAGPCGIAAAKAVLDAGFHDVAIYDRGEEVGGNWVFDADSGHSSVFETTHIISSKKYSQYDDYPMPEDYPDYPSHQQLAAYFQGYARHFGLYRYIRFGTMVERCDLLEDGRWRVRTDRGEESFDWLLVANGHPTRRSLEKRSERVAQAGTGGHRQPARTGRADEALLNLALVEGDGVGDADHGAFAVNSRRPSISSPAPCLLPPPADRTGRRRSGARR